MLWAHSAAAVFGREARSEWRTRASLGTTLLFAVGMLAALAFVLAQKSVSADIRAALYWVLMLFTAVTGLARVYVREEEIGTADALRLAAPATAVHTGKLLFNLLLLGAVQLASTVLFFVALPQPQTDGQAIDARLFAETALLGGYGLAAGATFIAALIAPAGDGGGRGALFFIAAFPILLPLLRPAVQGTLAALAPIASPLGTGANCLVLLITYDVVVTAASLGLIGAVWNE